MARKVALKINDKVLGEKGKRLALQFAKKQRPAVAGLLFEIQVYFMVK
jgi:hypothetical protein